MKRIIYHILIPAIMPVVFFRIATLPVEVLGCVAFPASAPSHSDILMDGVPQGGRSGQRVTFDQRVTFGRAGVTSGQRATSGCFP
jgi:hypothetical protein